MSHHRVQDSVDRLARWLAGHAPRALEGLLPPLTSAEIAACEEHLGAPLPEGLAALYRAVGGQDADPGPGLLRGYYLMPRDGVDGFLGARGEMLEAASAGAPWASADLFPFAKDFGGCFLAVDAPSGRVLEIADGEVEERASSMASFLAALVMDLEAGEVEIADEPEVLVELFEVVFDASRARRAGDPVTHSVFEEVGIEGTVEPLEELMASPFENHRGPWYGFAARLVAREPDRVNVEVRQLLDGEGRALGAQHGKQSGGGKPGVVVFVASKRPLPPNCRLHVEIQRLTPR